MRKIWFLRTMTLGILFFISARPVSIRPDSGLSSHWAVLLDASESMNVKDPVSRFDTAKKIAADIVASSPNYKVFLFSDNIEPVLFSSLDKQKAVGKKTNMAHALQWVFDKEKWRGAVVLTDGRQVNGEDPLSVAAALGRPVVLVGLGDRTLFKDIAVRSIQSPPFAFKNIQSSLSATISATGYKGKTISIRLKEGEKLISVQTIQPSADDSEITIQFQWTPAVLGPKTLTVQAEVQVGEITLVNNRKDVTVDVGRDRFRVLYICGEPGPEYGFLRHQFKSDPAVELVTFVILRNSQNVLTASESELSLIPFPTQDVLINQMSSFDLIVFEEFAYQQYGLSPAVVLAVRRKVEEGGSFLLMGGPQVFSSGSSYSVPAISEMIPVQIGSPDTMAFPDSLPIQIKAPSHPILKLEADPNKNSEIWNNLPWLDGITLLPPAKSGSTVLATVRVGLKEHPILAVWKMGKGRVAALAARTTWRWSMQSGEIEQSSDVYQQFWKNMVLWLTHSDEYKSVRMLLENKALSIGETQSLRIWVYDEYFKPVTDADVRLQLIEPTGKTQILSSRIESNGVYLADIKGDMLGRYEIEAWATRRGKKMGQEKIVFHVTEGFSEQEDLRPDFELLRETARVSNGRFFKAEDFSVKLLKEYDGEVVEKGGRKILIWNSPWFLFALLGLLGGEWVLRKKRGLP